MVYIYDIETFPNYFSVIFKIPSLEKTKEFIIFEDCNDLDELYHFINDNTKWLIGYNSFYFDNQILNYIYKAHSQLTFADTGLITSSINNLANLIIESEYAELKYNLPFKAIDLMKIGGYKKSLKLLGVNLKWHKLQDLPYPKGTQIIKDQVDIIRKYNLNDVLITEKLYYHLRDSIEFRHSLSSKYDLHLYGESDTGIANRLLEKFYSETTGLEYKHFKNLRTERNFIKFDWVVFKDIDFETPELIKLLEEIKNHTYYKDQPFFTKKFTFNGTIYKLGIGGIHSVDRGAIFTETETISVIDADIASMYPATLINHELTPEHLGSKFLINFVDLRNKRIEAKRNGDKTVAEGLKLVMNATIGKTRSKYSWLYDPLVNLQITLNGQLYILMLIEKLELKGFNVISANTDGIITLVDKSKEEEYYEICSSWEDSTKYELEYNYYTKYIRRDVNNYIAINENGYVKTKGVFMHEYPGKFNNATDPLNKGWDKPIVSIALYHYFVNQIPIEETIRKHKDIYDFCIAKKIDEKFTNEYHCIKEGKQEVNILQKSVRYYVSIGGGTLLKTNRTENVIEQYEANKTVTIFNDFVQQQDYKIDYGYYINATYKIINEIINQQLSLWDIVK